MTTEKKPDPAYKVVGKPPVPARTVCKRTGATQKLHHGHYEQLQRAAEQFEHWNDNSGFGKPVPVAVRRYLDKTGYRLIPGDIASALYAASWQVRTPPPMPPIKAKRKDTP